MLAGCEQFGAEFDNLGEVNLLSPAVNASSPRRAEITNCECVAAKDNSNSCIYLFLCTMSKFYKGTNQEKNPKITRQSRPDGMKGQDKLEVPGRN
jgi:hypothetical protein